MYNIKYKTKFPRQPRKTSVRHDEDTRKKRQIYSGGCNNILLFCVKRDFCERLLIILFEYERLCEGK